MLIWNLPPMITPTKRFGLGLIYSLGGAISGTPKRRPLHWCADRWQIAIACLCGRSAERGRRIREKEGSQPGGVAKKYRKGPNTIKTGPRGKKRNYLTDIQGDPQLVSQVRHHFFRTYVGAAGCPLTWWTGIVVGLIFWKKILKFFIWSGSGPGTSSAWFSGSAWFWAWSSLSWPRVFNFLAWKPLHLVNLTLNFLFWGHIDHVKGFSGQKIEYPWPT